MKVGSNVFPELADHRLGRRFRKRPSDIVISDFLQHVWRTGLPHTWSSLTTTAHPKGEAPTILRAFSIPKRLRNGQTTRAPCSICSDSAPKFDHGYIVFCSDGYVRIIGHDCGHEFFGDSYANALRNHEEETTEESARRLLLERLPDLARTLLEAVTVAQRLRALLDFRERAFSTITFSAVASMRRTRIGDQLTVDIESPATDDRGLRLVERIKVSSVGGLDMLMPRSGVLAALMKSIQIASLHWTPMGEDRHESLRAMTRQEAFGAAKAVRDLDVALTNARATHEGLVQLLAPTGLLAMAQWGQHGQCPKPFWIEIVGNRVYLSKGVRPRYWDRRAFLPLPGDENYQLVVVK